MLQERKMKDQLIFDTTDANTIADSDSVGAFVRSSDGTLITHTTNGGKESLDVNVTGGVNVEVDLSHLDDSIRLGDGTDFFTSTSENGDVALDVHISNTSIEVTATALDIRPLTNADVVTIEDGGGSITVDAVDLDMRDLVFATDKVDVSGSTILGITNDVSIDDGGNSITVDAVDLDIRDITAVSDSIASHMFDGAGTALTSTLVGADQALDVNLVNTISINDAALADTAILSAADTLAVAGTAEKVIAANLADRKYLSIYNNDNRKMYVGAAGVTSANGFPISPGSYIEMRAGAAVDVYYNSAKAGHEIRTLELS